MSDALRRIARTLGEAQFRVLSELEWSAPEPPHVASCSVGQLVEATGLSRSNVRRAIDSLIERGLVSSDGGTATRASCYRLNFLETAVLPGLKVPIGRGPIVGPPPVEKDGQVGLFQAPGGPIVGPLVGLSQAHVPLVRGPIVGPPPNEESETSEDRSKERARAARIENYSSTNDEVLDRVLRAGNKKLDDDDLAWGFEWLHGYMRKFGPERDPHAPDARIIAQFLAVAPRSRLEALLKSMFKARVAAGRNYAWFISVALDRIYGMKYQALRDRQAELELVKPPRPAPPEQQQLTARDADEVQFGIGDLKAEIKAAAAKMGGRR